MNEFEQGYIECLLWADCGPDSEQPGATINDLAPETMERIKRDCASFLAHRAGSLTVADLLRAVIDETTVPYTMARAGHEFWLTRNHHGAGFWDRGLGPVGDQLTAYAHEMGDCDVYKGDDGQVYLT